MIFKNVNPTKFVDELLQKKIEILEAFYNEEDNSTIIEFAENTDLDLVNNLYINHNPVLIPKPTLEERLKAVEMAMLEVL